ncbi:MAG: CaiB/BaiF CoA-transferase family protein [Chloroflexota bacterium]|nr:CaiB/BaiF CoA-transferase family protein [Chloroflexota bacterium]
MTTPLEGIMILDLTRLAPGPYCTMLLSDLGAEVIKIEEPGPPTGRRAEQAKGVPPARPAMIERDSPYNAVNRNKKSIGLNLKDERARQVFFKLVEKADVVVEEFRPGVTKRLGVDYDTLKKINPRLIYCAVTGYGQDGPYVNDVGHDINYISTAGALGILGEVGGKQPAIPHNFLADYAGGGMHAAMGVLAALVARQKTGRGQFVDVAMADGVVTLMAGVLSAYYANRQLPKPGTTVTTGSSPFYNAYQTKDGKWLSIGAIEPWFYANLCRAVGREDFIPHQYAEGEKQKEIFEAFRKAFRSKTRDEWVAILKQTDICAAKVYELDELAQDPQLRHRKMIVEVEGPDGKKYTQVGISLKFSETPGQIKSVAPTLGSHTDEVLRGLGYSQKAIGELREAGAIK